MGSLGGEEDDDGIDIVRIKTTEEKVSFQTKKGKGSNRIKRDGIVHLSMTPTAKILGRMTASGDEKRKIYFIIERTDV